MSAADQSAYRAALEPWAKKAERERKVIEHVRWADGHASVIMVPRSHGASRESGSLFPTG